MPNIKGHAAQEHAEHITGNSHLHCQLQRRLSPKPAHARHMVHVVVSGGSGLSWNAPLPQSLLATLPCMQGLQTLSHAACCLSPRHWCQPLIPHLACSDLPSDLLRPPPAVFPCQKATAAIRHGPAASIVGEIGAHHTRAEKHQTESELASSCTAPRPILQSLHAVPDLVPSVASAMEPLCRGHAAATPATSVLQASHMSFLQVHQ